MKPDYLIAAESEVKRLTAGWRAGPQLCVVATPSDLPIKAPGDARGLYMRQSVWLVASTQHAVHLADTVNHEAVAHFGLRKMFSPACWRTFMFSVRSAAHAGDCLLGDLQNNIRRVYVNDSGECTLSRLAEADEITAAVAETFTKYGTGRIEAPQAFRKRAKAAIGQFSRRALYLDVPVDTDALVGTLLAAQHRIRYGDGFFGIGFRMRRCYSAAMAKTPWNPHKAPMSLGESERLLEAESNRIRDRGEWHFLGLGAGLIGALLLFAIGIGAVVWGLFINLSWLFG